MSQVSTASKTGFSSLQKVGSSVVGACQQIVNWPIDQCEKIDQAVDAASAKLNSFQFESCSGLLAGIETCRHDIKSHPHFQAQTKNLSTAKQEQLATVLASKHTPLAAYMEKSLGSERKNILHKQLLQNSAKMFADDSHLRMTSILKETASKTGFSRELSVIQGVNKTTLDYIGTSGQKLFAIIRQDPKSHDLSLSLDLEGFPPDSDQCVKKMDEIVHDLQQRGLNFDPKRFTHHQPHGVLRKKIKALENSLRKRKATSGKNRISNN